MKNSKNKKKIMLIALAPLSIIPISLAAACTKKQDDNGITLPDKDPDNEKMIPDDSIMKEDNKSTLYLSLYHLNRVEYNKIPGKEKKSYKFVEESKQILQKLLEIDKENQAIIQSGIIFIDDFKKYIDGDQVLKEFPTKYLTDKKYADYLYFLSEQNFKFREIVSGQPKPANHFSIVKKYWKLLNNSKYEFWSLFYINDILEEYINLKENDANKKTSVQAIINILKDVIDKKQNLTDQQIAQVKQMIEAL
ncbi:hypothetical protein [Mycoplasma phocoeninasale]|uniref:hypothetical protein n=1 Tax=Mycoplasma phocoeninasale TaxID=2726117 RepID=UPI0019683900|nr:hypothetical protein [Mycoplasma phocoeninasale]MBN0970640.1 hypothetical protein [Mycoplasma phocoeninasale]